MPVIRKSKSNDEDYLNVQPDELEPPLEAELKALHIAQAQVRAMQADFARHFGIVYPQYAGLPLGHKFAPTLSVALDAERRDPKTAKVKQSLTDFNADRVNSGRAM
jgi:hypothetical protein